MIRCIMCGEEMGEEEEYAECFGCPDDDCDESPCAHYECCLAKAEEDSIVKCPECHKKMRYVDTGLFHPFWKCDGCGEESPGVKKCPGCGEILPARSGWDGMIYHCTKCHIIIDAETGEVNQIKVLERLYPPEDTELITCEDCADYGHCILQRYYGVLLCEHIQVAEEKK